MDVLVDHKRALLPRKLEIVLAKTGVDRLIHSRFALCVTLRPGIQSLFYTLANDQAYMPGSDDKRNSTGRTNAVELVRRF